MSKVSVPPSPVRVGRFSPHAIESTGLSLAITGCALDGRDEQDLIDRARRRVELEGVEFTELALDLSVELSERAEQAVLSRLLGASRTASALSLVVTVQCASTRHRRAQRLAAGAVRAGTHSGRLLLHRDDFSDRLILQPHVVLAAQGIVAQEPQVLALGRRLSSGEPWTVREAAPARPAAGLLEIRYCDFAQDALLSSQRDTLYRLDGDQERPVLWINRAHDKVVAVLDERGSRGVRARLRDVFFDQIAYAVWTQLFLRAAARLRDGLAGRYGWEQAVLRQVLPEMYPTAATRSAQLSSLQSALEDGDIATLIEQLDRALQRKNEASAHMTRLSNEILERGTR